jgi:hypothetical protein
MPVTISKPTLTLSIALKSLIGNSSEPGSNPYRSHKREPLFPASPDKRLEEEIVTLRATGCPKLHNALAPLWPSRVKAIVGHYS